MARDGMHRVTLPDGVHARFQVACQLVANESAPIEVVRVRKYGREAGRDNLIPGVKVAVPRSVQRIERLILPLQPLAKPGLSVLAITKLGIREEGKFRPVDDVRLAPDVPAIESRRAIRIARKLLEKPDNLPAHARMVYAESRCGLRIDDRATPIHEPAIGEFEADPVGSGVEIDLNNDAKAPLLRQAQEEVKIRKRKLTGLWFRSRPVNPRLDRIEAGHFDGVKILAPSLGAGRIHGFQHRRPSFAATVPDSHGIKGAVVLRDILKLGSRSRGRECQNHPGSHGKRSRQFHLRRSPRTVRIYSRYTCSLWSGANPTFGETKVAGRTPLFANRTPTSATSDMAIETEATVEPAANFSGIPFAPTRASSGGTQLSMAMSETSGSFLPLECVACAWP